MKKRITFANIAIILGCVFSPQASGADVLVFQKGLVGNWYGGPDLNRPKDVMSIRRLDERCVLEVERGRDWSAQWRGFIKAPYSGEITFEMNVSTGGILKIDGQEVINQWAREGLASGKFQMVEDKMYPIEVSYRRDGGNPRFQVSWSWSGKAVAFVPEDVLFHTSTDIQVSESQIAIPPVVKQLPDVEHVIVYHEDGIFAAWPANHGAWIWDDDEILVGFTIGPVEVQPGHNIGDDQDNVLARSRDGGKTWQLSDPPNYELDSEDLIQLEAPIDFSHEGFALKVIGNGFHSHSAPDGAFYITYDRGETWQGPYPFTGLAGNEEIQQIVNVNIEEWPSKESASAEWIDFQLTPRSDYFVINDSEALLFLSARPRGRGNFAMDRYFCVRTTNGGMSFDFVSWVVPPSDPYRAVMSQTVQVNDSTMVSVARRRTAENDNWIDAYVTTDGGQSWSFQSRVADAGRHNGNPPAIVKTDDGRLVCVFGNRSKRAVMASYSSDNGETWTEAVAIRGGDFEGPEGGQDFGYPRLLKRSDGKLVAIYYWSTEDHPYNISATIWKP